MKTKIQQVDRVALRKVRKFFPQVESVRDATKPINIEVSARDSDHAKLKDHNHCALAVACEKKMHADGVIISVKTAYVVKGKRAIRYKLLETTAREVVSFDRKGGLVQNLGPKLARIQVDLKLRLTCQPISVPP